MGRKELNRDRRVIYCRSELSNSEIVSFVEDYARFKALDDVVVAQSQKIGELSKDLVIEDGTPTLDDLYNELESTREELAVANRKLKEVAPVDVTENESVFLKAALDKYRSTKNMDNLIRMFKLVR